MHNEELFAQRVKNVQAALAHQEGEYVPILATAGGAGIAYAGKTVPEVYGDPQAYADALNKVYDDMWADCIWTNGLAGTIFLEDYFGDVQYKLAPDQVTLTHVQIPSMEKEDYPAFLEDPEGFIINTLVARRYPKFFQDRAWGVKGLEKIADTLAYIYGVLGAAAFQDVAQNRNILPIIDLTQIFQNPLDILFDHMRGFKGTITDLRREPEYVKAACEKMWELKCVPMMAKPLEKTFPYPVQFTHMPAYLRPKQFEEVYWPYEKKYIEYLASQGSKLMIVIEGRWENIYQCFLDVPKDSCVICVDDDDIFKLYDVLGGHQIIVGGVKLIDTRSGNTQKAIDDAKRVIDYCAPGGGFMLTTDKAWIAPGDINDSLVETMNALHEYGKH